jgi:hypothetical protein
MKILKTIEREIFKWKMRTRATRRAVNQLRGGFKNARRKT